MVSFLIFCCGLVEKKVIQCLKANYIGFEYKQGLFFKIYKLNYFYPLTLIFVIHVPFLK